MKYLFIVFFAFTLVSAHAEADGRLFCKDAGQISSATTSSYYEFMDDCSEAVYFGDVCFTGSRKVVKEILEIVSGDIFGGEYSINSIYYVGKDKLHYSLWDGPNEMGAGDHIISRCSKDFFK